MLDLEPIKALLASVPSGVTEPDGLTWTRLGPEGGVLHTGGSCGIVYAGCLVAGLTADPDRDPAIDLIAAAPALLAALVADVERLTKEWDEACGLLASESAASERLRAVLTALVDDSEGQQHRVAWQDACEALHGHRGPEAEARP